MYRAKDTRLDREVAIKVLPVDFAHDAHRLKRFEQEARATSALNHPNILTVHYIGTHEGAPYIVAELLEGEELRAQLDQGALPVRKAIEYAQQIAAGLAAAHEKGIVHRDLKPENLFVTKDGRVKILDFGLAKLKPQTVSGDAGSEAATLKPLTDPGVVMGTVGYMSPEQVRGQETDHRSDVFSFGIILHEMLSGQRTFTGDSAVELMNAILKEEPADLSETNAKISPALDKIVRRCLEKKPEQRFQTATDLGFALSTLSSLAGGPSVSHPDSQLDTGTALPAATESLPGRAWLFRNAWLALLVMVIAALAFGLYRFASRKETGSAPSFESMKITKLTDTGKAGSAAISPDGKYVVHVKEEAGQRSLWVVHIATGSNVQIIPTTEFEYGRMTFSPDGSYIYFVRKEKGEPNFALYQVPVLGGEPTRLNSNVSSAVTFSPDGKRFAFARNQPGDSTIMIANADGTGEQPLATRKSPEIFGSIGPAWSPDGKAIATSIVITDGGYRNDIVEVRVEDGAIKPISTQKWFAVLRVAWLADGSGLIAACREIGSNTYQIYQISYPGAEARKITNDLNDHTDASLTADSGSMVTVQENHVLNPDRWR